VREAVDLHSVVVAVCVVELAVELVVKVLEVTERVWKVEDPLVREARPFHHDLLKSYLPVELLVKRVE